MQVNPDKSSLGIICAPYKMTKIISLSKVISITMVKRLAMVVSTAFRELTEVLNCLEQVDIDVRDVTLDEQAIQADDEITVDLCVGVPVLDGLELREGIAIEAGDTDLTEEKLSIDLSVSVPTDRRADDRSGVGFELGNAVPAAVDQTASSGQPAYKDPDTLQEVYERYDTFPKMTAALGVDVTSETVRRYMVKHGIHQPDDADGTGMTDEDADETDDVRGFDSSDVSVAEALASADQDENEETLAADGLGVPKELTVGELAEIVTRSRTVHEAKQHLDIDYAHTRRLLSELDLIDFISGRLSTSQDEVTAEDVYARLGVGGDTTPRE